MNEQILLHELNTQDHGNILYFNEVYGYSFPDYEQRTREGRMAVLREASTFHAWVLSFKGKNAGILGGWYIGEWFYIEHFSVDKALRRLGIGKLAMAHINTRFQKVILEIDPPEDSVSCKRLEFYKRSGYVTNGIPHVHPSYKATYSPHRLEVLSFPRSLTVAEYETFNHQLQEVVMAACWL
jgi:GNAT superfamily N-acetyltransferase